MGTNNNKQKFSNTHKMTHKDNQTTKTTTMTTVKLPIQVFKNFLGSEHFQREADKFMAKKNIDFSKLMKNIKVDNNSQLKFLIKRNSIHISVKNVENDNQKGFTIETDKIGFQKSHEKLQKLILRYLEILQIENQEILKTAFGLLDHIQFKIPIVFKGKPHKGIALVIILLACR